MCNNCDKVLKNRPTTLKFKKEHPCLICKAEEICHKDCPCDRERISIK